MAFFDTDVSRMKRPELFNKSISVTGLQNLVFIENSKDFINL